jgi:hypothetical protein
LPRAHGERVPPTFPGSASGNEINEACTVGRPTSAGICLFSSLPEIFVATTQRRVLVDDGDVARLDLVGQLRGQHALVDCPLRGRQLVDHTLCQVFGSLSITDGRIHVQPDAPLRAFEHAGQAIDGEAVTPGHLVRRAEILSAEDDHDLTSEDGHRQLRRRHSDPICPVA